jgi:hypothetical protein
VGELKATVALAVTVTVAVAWAPMVAPLDGLLIVSSIVPDCAPELSCTSTSAVVAPAAKLTGEVTV